MMVMAANGSYPWLHYWAGRDPGSVGHLYSPGGQRGPYKWLPYALDNGAFTGFREAEWIALLRWACLCGTAPLWVAVPDVVGDPVQTYASWLRYAPDARRFGWPLAFVVQDGARAESVPSGADVVFVGGSLGWKHDTIRYWCEHFPRVHVGRVNSLEWLRRCERLGVESVDGTGWGRGDKRQLADLMQFLEEHNGDRVVGSAGVRGSSLVGGDLPVNPPMLRAARPPMDGDADDQEHEPA